MQEAKQLHAHIIVSGLQQQEHYLRKLITFLAITNPFSIDYARVVFDRIHIPSTFIYNTMIRAYASSPHPQQALYLHYQMHKHGYSPPDKYTFPFLLKACSNLFNLRKGEETHCQLIKYGFDSDIFVQNSLIYLYGSNDKIITARRVFDEMGVRDIASWTTLVTCYLNFGSVELARNVFNKMPKRSAVSFSAMIAGYIRKGRYGEALELFHNSQIARIEPNDSMIMSVLCACASLGALDMGRWVHSYISELKANKFDSRISTALIDMYFKCGSINDGVRVFSGTKQKQVGEWTAMISGIAMHGNGEICIDLFEEMVTSGVRPNLVTFVALLAGCAHAGLVNEGLRYFQRMKSEFRIEPTIEHFGCVVDILGRAGRINQALKFINEMPMEANAAIWGALLNACRVHKNVDLGQVAARWLIREEPWNGAIYMTLLNLYKETERWEDVEGVKQEMKDVCCRKNPGCSLIEVNGVCHEFVVGDRSDSCAFELCLKLGELIMELEENH
ncbi:Pentatricopeptide repeat-containing protein [Thalictrum thalictroides]|uniref:Pentatricopeptide repeat-containing protein n=1 Tax=Thalictrum thalictroides TaxID=46969 RepID=A0A7J6UUF5_THATH|nr:Pentatricopeptide repeat-containing protein [Thalictrum thalictroides]